MKTVLITGGTRGIGRALAIDFAKEGYRVAVCYSKDEKSKLDFEQVLNKENLAIDFYKVDISNEMQVKTMFKSVIEKFKHIDVLINNAGIALIKQFQDTTLDDWNSIMNTNLTGAFLCSKEATRNMLDFQNGLIINISSMWGQVGASCEVAYSASKAGLIGLTKALAKELAPSNIRVNCISAGMIDTTMNSHLSKEEINSIVDEIPLARIGTVNDISKTALFLAETDSYITGQVIGVNGGLII